jgi:hypothetical protein
MTRRVDPDNRSQVMEDELARIREWAQDRLDAHHHIPWDSRRYQHLVTLIDDMLGPACAGRGAGNIVYLNSARRRSGAARHPGIRTSG